MSSELVEVASKGLRVSKNEVSGLISMLMSDFSNPNIDLLLTIMS